MSAHECQITPRQGAQGPFGIAVDGIGGHIFVERVHGRRVHVAQHVVEIVEHIIQGAHGVADLAGDAARGIR